MFSSVRIISDSQLDNTNLSKSYVIYIQLISFISKKNDSAFFLFFSSMKMWCNSHWDEAYKYLMVFYIISLKQYNKLKEDIITHIPRYTCLAMQHDQKSLQGTGVQSIKLVSRLGYGIFTHKCSKNTQKIQELFLHICIESGKIRRLFQTK